MATCRTAGCQHLCDAGLSLVKQHTSIETSATSGEPDPAPLPALALERSLTWPSRAPPPRLQQTPIEEGIDGDGCEGNVDGGGDCSDTDSESDTFPLDADADFPLAPDSGKNAPLYLPTPDELIYKCTWAGSPIGGGMPAGVTDPAPLPTLTLERSLTWPTRAPPLRLQQTLIEEGIVGDGCEGNEGGGGDCSDTDSESDTFPLDADADFPLALDSGKNAPLYLPTPDELIYKCTWAGAPIGGGLPAGITECASAQPMTPCPPPSAAQCKQTALDAAVYPQGSGFQQRGPPEGPQAQGCLMLVQQPTDGRFAQTPPPPEYAATSPVQGGEQLPPAAPEGDANSSVDRYLQARAAQAIAPGLQQELNSRGDIHRVQWNVESWRLNSTNKEIVSLPFELNVGGPVNFRLMLYSKVDDTVRSIERRGHSSFRRSKGKGGVMLKCIDSVSTQTKVKFRIVVGSAASKKQQPRDPVTHDFFETPVAHLPTGSDEWNFKKLLNVPAETFSVCLEILPASD